MPPTAPEAVLYEAIRLVRPLYRHVYRAVENGLADERISVAMRALLEYLHEHGPATVPAIARALVFPRQVIQRLADALRERGLVERAANPTHRRSYLFRLTAAGTATIERVFAREVAALRELAAPLAERDLATFRSVMTYLVETLARRAPVAPEADAGERGAIPPPRDAARRPPRRRRSP